MKNFNLLVNRQISLHLNAKEKLKVMAFVSKDWRKLVYCGYAWEYLFDSDIDESWEEIKLS